MQAGGGRELPAEYRPDYAMLEEYYRALSRLHRMTDMVLQDERAVRLAVSAVWYRVRGKLPSPPHFQPPCVYPQAEAQRGAVLLTQPGATLQTLRRCFGHDCRLVLRCRQPPFNML